MNTEETKKINVQVDISYRGAIQLQAMAVLQQGKYRIESVLGQGGFGITYMATQTALNKKVAIKEFFFKEYCERDVTGTLRISNVSNTGMVERFRQKFEKEARTISQLSHPNIVSIHDTFEENGTAYYVMDYIEGQSLEEMVNQNGAFPENIAIDYIKQVASALDYIHKRSINHLDVKPANIMVRRSDNKAILIDFGVSKQYDAYGGQTSTTPIGISHGYAPIEQYNPNGVATFSPQADIYSLGATLYKLITGETPPPAIELISKNSYLIRHESFSELVRYIIDNSMKPRQCDRINSAVMLMGGKEAVKLSKLVEWESTASGKWHYYTYIGNGYLWKINIVVLLLTYVVCYFFLFNRIGNSLGIAEVVTRSFLLGSGIGGILIIVVQFILYLIHLITTPPKELL